MALADDLDHGPVDRLTYLTDHQNALCQPLGTGITISPVVSSRNSITPLFHAMATKEGGGCPGENIHSLLHDLFLRKKWPNDHRLAVIFGPIQTCISKVDALLNPLDIAAQALRWMSFLPLVAVASGLQRTRPEQASRLGLLALEKVRGKGDLREAGPTV